MPAAVALQGSAELKARLEAIMTLFEPVAAQWASDAASNMRHKIYSPTGKMRSSVEGYYNNRDGWVEADWRVTFIDRGHKDVKPRFGKALLLGGEWYGKPSATSAPYRSGAVGKRAAVFATKTRGVRKRPFIRSSATQALRDNPMGRPLIALWNAAGRKGGAYVLGNKANAKRRAQARRLR